MVTQVLKIQVVKRWKISYVIISFVKTWLCGHQKRTSSLLWFLSAILLGSICWLTSFKRSGLMLRAGSSLACPGPILSLFHVLTCFMVTPTLWYRGAPSPILQVRNPSCETDNIFPGPHMGPVVHIILAGSKACFGIWVRRELCTTRLNPFET